jgi:hypothetical protein
MDLATTWYFQVEMEPVTEPAAINAGRRSDSFWVFIDFSGRPGKIEPRDGP